MFDYKFIDNNDLSVKAKGMMMLLLKYPNASVRDLMSYTYDGKTAIYTGIKELELKGYIRTVQSGAGKPQRDLFPNGPEQ